jgi:hypothetical protein
MLTNLRSDTRFDNYQADIYHQQFIYSNFENLHITIYYFLTQV